MQRLYKALTICQPYASLIMFGDKRVENRSWHVDIKLLEKGLVIHAGKNRDWLDSWDGPIPEPMPFGMLLGLVDVPACFHISHIADGRVPESYAWLADHEHATGSWCWVLDNVRPFKEFHPWSGHPGLFGVPDRIVEECLPGKPFTPVNRP